MMIESKEPKLTPQEDIDLLQDAVKAQQEKILERSLWKVAIKNDFKKLLESLRDLKGDDRSPMARHCAIVITLLETAYARFCVFVQ